MTCDFQWNGLFKSGSVSVIQAAGWVTYILIDFVQVYVHVHVHLTNHVILSFMYMFGSDQV